MSSTVMPSSLTSKARFPRRHRCAVRDLAVDRRAVDRVLDVETRRTEVVFGVVLDLEGPVAPVEADRHHQTLVGVL